MSNLVCSALSLDLIVFCLFNSIKFLSRPLDASPSQGDTVNTTTRKNYSGAWSDVVVPASGLFDSSGAVGTAWSPSQISVGLPC